MLATEVSNALVVTDVCRRLADSTSAPVDVDEYLSFLVPRFYHPAPMFQDYAPTAQQYFSFCAVLKYLLAAYQEQGQEPSLSLNDVFSLIIGNNCAGTEPLSFYKTLRPTGHVAQGDQSRQVRELLAFISQSSFLKWHRNRLYLDILSGDTESVQAFEPMMNPIVQARNSSQANEILSMGKEANIAFLSAASSARRQPADVLFTEGKRVRVTHLRTERSPILRDAFFKHLLKPYLCDMCVCNPKTTYPWTDNILEIHHLLPLSSTFVVTLAGTSLRDVVALCPNCHKSVHTYYKSWLN